MKEYYQDIYGDIWVLVATQTIQRLRDGNFGGFWNGKDLIKVAAPKESV